MDGMKYIAFERVNSFDSLIIFPADIDHAQAARDVGVSPIYILGAGFIKMDSFNEPPYCYGRSTSLNIKSRGSDDTRLLHRQLGAS